MHLLLEPLLQHYWFDMANLGNGSLVQIQLESYLGQEQGLQVKTSTIQKSPYAQYSQLAFEQEVPVFFQGLNSSFLNDVKWGSTQWLMRD